MDHFNSGLETKKSYRLSSIRVLPPYLVSHGVTSCVAAPISYDGTIPPSCLSRATHKYNQGWNQIQFNLSDFTRRAYGTNYIETLRVQIHANCRIRRIYFSDRLYSEEELPPEFKLFLPITKQEGQGQQAPLAAT